MKILIRTATVLFLTPAFTVQASDTQKAFDLDVSIEDFQRSQNQFLLTDLSVGDTARLDNGYACFEDKRIFFDPHAPVTNDSGVNWKVTVLPSRTLSIEIVDNDKQASEETVFQEVSGLLNWFSCSAYRETYRHSPESFFLIKSINGSTSLSQLIEKGK